MSYLGVVKFNLPNLATQSKSFEGTSEFYSLNNEHIQNRVKHELYDQLKEYLKKEGDLTDDQINSIINIESITIIFID